ncbi:TonB-dependent receptor [Xanthovirga aplysinae]|uniref:TonB-dependent receptor n=1 Tax=Xanthovirga aplysinae TaxID=2529853 RepID=UPI0012BBDC15|nr:TonB-dependent receptor [Xanthovirga aplysinae]MTI33231.1 TonB-dependent receptor [Xanthovirga aplysinae]
MKKFLLIFTLSIFTLAAQAQTGSVKGRILDTDTGEGLFGASVAIKGTTLGAMSDFDGNFIIEKVEAGKHSLLVSYVGYEEFTQEISVKEGETIDISDIKLKGGLLNLESVEVMASIAEDRKTPVAVSNISAEDIETKLGSQEFPEILKATPGVYTTKGQGGGFGDGRINLRGFDSNNVGVLINGVPVNDMENGRVYWSNWAGLSDVTRTMQVQRGLGASKLAISSVGGTINIITKSTDAVKGGSAYVGVGNDGYHKTGLTLSTGLMDNGWAVTVSGSRTAGNGYIDATSFEGYSYFASIAKKINDNHELVLTGFGAPQWHNQRNLYKKTIEDYENHPSGHKWNNGWGYRDGEEFNGAYSYNYYHKPQISLNHYWTVNPKTEISTALYASIGSGGGRRANRVYNASVEEDPLQLIHWDDIIAGNKQLASNGEAVESYLLNSVNKHNWYGILTSVNTELSEKISFTGGLDARYYLGQHYRELSDLLGGSFAYDVDRDGISNNVNSADGKVGEGDKIQYHNDGQVIWLGGFAQAEYTTDQFSAFLTTALSNTSYTRTDYFLYTPGNQKSETVDFLGYSIKGGVNYNINDYHNIFANGGYFSRAPFMNMVFAANTNTISEGVDNEDVISMELGYGLRTSWLSANVALYNTHWNNRAFSTRINQLDENGLQKFAIINGQNALHQGIEIDFTAKPVQKLQITGMVSLGDWTWNNNVSAQIQDNVGNVEEVIETYSEGLKVGDAAQTTAAIGVSYEVIKDLKVSADFNHASNLYAQFDPSDRQDSEVTDQAWELPAYNLLDLGVRYNFKAFGLDLTLTGKVNNILDTIYIAEAEEGDTFDAAGSYVYYGFGRTWNAGLKVKF